MPRTGKNIYKRKDGRWEGRYIASRDENGKAKYACVYGKSEHEVEAMMIEKRAEIRAAERADKAMFSDIVEEWLLDRRENVTDASADRYEYLMQKYILPAFGEKEFEDVNQVQLGTYIADLGDKNKHGKNAVAASTLQALKSLTDNIFKFVQNRDTEIPDLSAIKNTTKDSYLPLAPGEIRKVISCAKYNRSPEMLGVLLSLYTGIGTGELCALSWDDFDIERREISITHTIYRIKNKDAEDGDKRTMLSVTNVRKSAVRTVQYPLELTDYVAEYYRKGCIFLTCEKDKYQEQKTFCNRLDSAFRVHGLGGVTLARIKKTYEAGLSDVRYLTDPFYKKAEGEKPQIQVKVDERWLIKEMENDLLSLRHILGISCREMGQVLGIGEEDYRAIEAGEAGMDWDMFLSFLFFFKYNSKTEPIVEALGLYPNALKERIGIG